MSLLDNYEYETRWCRCCREQFKVVKGLAGNPRKYCSDRCRKLKWDRDNKWKYQDDCPGCGGLKTMGSNFCHHCRPHSNPEGYNQYKTREETNG